MSLPWSNKFDYDYNKPSYGRGPAPWQSEAPRARPVAGQNVYRPLNSGSQQNFAAEWPGDRETSLPRVDSMLNQARTFAGQYLGTKLALGATDRELHRIEEDVHSLAHPSDMAADKREPLGLPAGARPMPPPSEPRALGPAPTPIPQGPAPEGRRPRFGVYGDVEAGDARLAGGSIGRLNYPNAIDVTPGRRTTGGNDRRMKNLITRQLNDRM